MKKIYFIFILTLTASFANAQWAGFTNTGGDELWSNDANWAFPGGVTELAPGQKIDIYQGPTTVTLDEAYTAKGLKMPANKAESFTLTGAEKLIIDIADGTQGNDVSGLKAIANDSSDPTTLTLDCDVTIANTATIDQFKGVSVCNINGHPDSKVIFDSSKTLEIAGTGTTSFWGFGEFHVNGTLIGAQGILVGGGAGGGILYLGSSTSDVSGFTGALTLANESELTLQSNGSSTINNIKVQLNGNVGKLTLESENVLNSNEIRVSTKAGQAFILNMFVNANQTLQGIKIKGDGSTLNLNIGSGVTSVAFGANNANWHANSIINIIGYKEGVVKFGTDNTSLNGGAYLANIRIDGQQAPMGEPLSLDAEGNLIGAASLVLSTEKHNAFQFSMYPNPVKEIINFNTKEPLASAKVYDLLGKEVLKISQPISNINVSSLNRGLYVLQLEAKNGGLVTRKFIKE
ncbi:T9SS type A sorting domain-containing protein [Algibacter mikhailovii]|uniref:Secretion system C-terminal sorting domain-containing protein n=1 Tax=Algibacter mikhailovii TaxID=425498 RepID=A0A918R6K7_9FLAO|nr:T9SS type A sorting domain-containing protein [Algibacter mikhailovii]GGZ87609.1 hypothetical protein GCM10007028_27250 [Algibacter mikhailovii]